ncbi:hypothetical protein Tco_0686181 [Tanacetum coccineum]
MGTVRTTPAEDAEEMRVTSTRIELNSKFVNQHVTWNQHERNKARGNVVAGDCGGPRTELEHDSGQAKTPIMLLQLQGIWAQARQFMANLSSEDPIYNEVGTSYDSNTQFEVQDHDTFVDHMDEYHEVHEMQKRYLEAKMSKVHNRCQNNSKLEREYLIFANLKYQHPSRKFDNNKSQASQEAQDLTHSLKIKNLATSDSREKEQTDRQIEKPKGKLSDNSLNKTKQIWQPKGKLFDNSLKKTKQVWKATGKLFANVGYQWRPTGKKFTSGKLNCGINGSPDRKIGKGNLLLDLQKLQKNPIFRISVDIRQNTNFVRAFTTSANVPSIYIQLFWNTLTHDTQLTPCDVTPAGKMDITFTRRRVPLNWLMKMKFNRLLNLIWMIMSTIYNKTTRKLPVVEVKGKGIDSADSHLRIKTTGPSVHLEDATYTKMVRETLSHADAESGGLLINILESEEVESTCKLDEYKLDQTPEQVMWLLLDQTLSTCMMSSLLLFTLRILEESWWEADV